MKDSGVEPVVATAETVTSPVELALDDWETAFERLLARVEDCGLAGHDDLALISLMQRLERARNRVALIDHRFVEAVEERRLADTFTQPSTAALLAWALRISRGEAARRVRAAGQLGERRSMTGDPLPPLRPALAAVQRTGQASTEQVDVCLRALATVDHRGFDPAQLDTADELLAGFCPSLGPKDLTALAGQVVDRIDPDGTLPADQVDAERRHLTLRTARDGMCVGEFRLTPALGIKLKTVLSPLAAPKNTVVAEHDGRPVTELDPRHHGQRMHDALEDACDRLLRSGTLPDSGGTPTTVILTTTLHNPSPEPESADPSPSGSSDATGTPATAAGSAGSAAGGRAGRAWHGGTASDGTRLSPDTVADLVDSAAVHPTVIDSKGVVLWMGRTSRLATPGQTMALIARDGGCSFPGCEHPPEWCERHHVIAWSDGGPTDLDNLTLLCRYHHRQFLARGWTCRMIDRLPTWYPPRWVDPDQRPLRNTRITTRHLVC